MESFLVVLVFLIVIIPLFVCAIGMLALLGLTFYLVGSQILDDIRLFKRRRQGFKKYYHQYLEEYPEFSKSQLRKMAKKEARKFYF
ncbi:MAG: hypothetical protein MJ060_04150 [Clostridia bacterium]|nr:hypothetical protein [Clostridia bacterium]